MIRTFIRNPVAANMLMILIVGGGLAASFLIPREVFPEFSIDIVTVSVPYPGASPDDIEKGICLKIEDYVSNIEGVKDVSSVSREGLGTVWLELHAGADVRKVLDDVRDEVGKITFPANAEDPIIQEATQKIHVIQVAVAGQADERTLRELAEDVKDDLTDLPEISQAYVSGVREYEISVEVDESARRRYGLTHGQIARAIRESSFDLPAGKVKTAGGEMTLRVIGQRYTAKEFETIPVLYLPDGAVVRLRDVAAVREAFEDKDIGGQFNGAPAALVSVYKTSDEDIIDIARAVRDYIEHKGPEMPEGIDIEAWSDLSLLVKDRLDMLVRNGLQGLVLVVLVLWLFLGLRLSFWVAMGVPISILGAILVMELTGGTLNMLSMFALIMSLGLIVDDAIIVGENVSTRSRRGETPDLAAESGTRQVLLPVTGAVITTWLAFVPLFFIPGIMGKFIGQIPAVVILTLGFSLLECLLILPSHLAHSLSAQRRIAARLSSPGRLNALRARAGAVRSRIDAGIAAVIDGGFMPLYRGATRHRYVTVSLFAGVLILMLAALQGGHIRMTMMPKIESDALQCELVMPTGTPIERTREVAGDLTRAVLKLNRQIATASGEPVVLRAYSLLGQQYGPGGQQGGHIAQVIVELLPAERRGQTVRSADIIARWRANAGGVPEALSLRFEPFRGGPAAKSLEMRVLADTTDEARRVVDRVKDRLRTYKGVSDVEDDALPGKIELRIRPRREALAAGVNALALAGQFRDAFYGNESIEVQRGRDEVKVMVRYPDVLRRSIGHVESMRIHTAERGELPLAEAADMTFARGYTTLRRRNGKRIITVSGDVDENIANAELILRELKDEGFFEAVTADAPAARIDLAGQRKQFAESLEALLVWFPMALLGIYTILAAVFKSYLQPIIVMVAIPFGLIGAVIGHWLLGFDVTLLSMFGMVALAGIVVNDSLVLIDMVNNRIRSGDSVHAAVAAGARGRFRAIVLTTVTTAAGMTPLLMERSFQAQFLKPMAVSIAFGLMFATLLTLLVVPCLYLIGNDVGRVLGVSPPGEL